MTLGMFIVIFFLIGVTLVTIALINSERSFWDVFISLLVVGSWVALVADAIWRWTR